MKIFSNSFNRLAEIVIADIRQKAAMVESDEDSLLERVGQTKAAESQMQLAALNAAKRNAESRRIELERLIQSLYEDKVKGGISEEVCVRLINGYEAERRDKAEEVQTLAAQIEGFQAQRSNTQEWIKAIRQFKDVEILSRDIILKLIDKVEIGEREIIGDQKQREIRIHYRFVGYIG